MHTRLWKNTLFVGLSVCVVLILLFYSQPGLPTPAGPYAVGQTAIRWVDASRPEVLTNDPYDVREVVVLAWYPAEAETGVETGYFSNLAAVSQALIESEEVEWWQVLALRFVRSTSLLDAQPLKDQAPYPVVIFSPGNGTNIEFYSSLAGELASHGYVVLGLNHPHDVAAVELSSGEVAGYAKEQWLLEPTAHQVYSTERIRVRTADVLFVREQLDEMNSSGIFAGTLDLDAVAAAGHSLGGITASEACKADRRFRACLNYDGLQRGGPFSMDEAASAPEQPFLFLTKEGQLQPRSIERFESAPELYWVIVHGASHQSFTDGPLLQPSLLPGRNQADWFMHLIQRYSLAFLDYALKGRSNTLRQEAVEQAEVTVNIFPSERNSK